MTSTTESASTAERLLESARLLYANIHAELAKTLDSIPLPAEDEAAKGRAEMIRSHRKALQTVLDIEMQIAKDEGRTGPGHGIDLEAARAEIYRRLDRLAVAGGNS